MKKFLASLLLLVLLGCATPIPTAPENFNGVFCTTVSTLTTKITSVLANISNTAMIETSPDCAIQYMNQAPLQPKPIPFKPV